MPVFTPQDFEKGMKDVDQDLRYMALYDLQQHLKSPNTSVSASDVATYARYLVKCFTDQERSNIVVNMAVRLLGPLCLRATDEQQEFMFANLSQQVFNEKIETVSKEMSGVVRMTANEITLVRDNVVMTMKVAVEEMASNHGAKGERAIHMALKILIRQLRDNKDPNIDERIRTDVYDLVNDMVAFGGSKALDVDNELAEVCLRELEKDTPSRKKATKCLATVSSRLSDATFAKVIQVLDSGLRGASKGRYIQACSVIAKSGAASRFGEKVGVLTKVLLEEVNRLNSLPDDKRDAPEADETRELILGAVESFAEHCAPFLAPLEAELNQQLLSLLVWDPNQVGDYANGVNAGQTAEDDDCEFEFEADEDADYDFQEEDAASDSSWRVRKAAARALSELLQRVADPTSLLQKLLVDNDGRTLTRAINDKVEQSKLEGLGLMSTAVVVAAASSAFALLRTAAARMHGDLNTLYKKEKIVKVKAVVLQVVGELLTRIGAGGSEPLLNETVNMIFLQDAPLNGDTLPLVKELVVLVQQLPAPQHAAAVILRLFAGLQRALVTPNAHYKVVLLSVDALRRALPLLQNKDIVANKEIDALYEAVLAKLEPSFDSDIRKQSLEVLSGILAARSAALSEAQCVQGKRAIIQLLTNELLQARAAEAFSASVHIVIPADLVRTASERFADLLRKSDPATREAAITALTGLLSQTELAKSVDNNVVQRVIGDLGGVDGVRLLDEKDLVLAAHALRLAKALPDSAAPRLRDIVVPIVLTLLDLSQPPANMVDAAAAFVSGPVGKLIAADRQVPALLTKATASPNHSAFVAGILSGLDGATVSNYLKQMETEKSLLCLGSLGRYVALPPSAVTQLVQGLQDADDAKQQGAAVGAGRSIAFLPSGANVLATLQGVVTQVKGREVLAALRGLREALALTPAASSLNVNTHLFAQPAHRATALNLLLHLCKQTDGELLLDTLSDLMGRLLCLDPTLIPTAVQSAKQTPFGSAVVICAARYLFTKESTLQLAEQYIQTELLPLLQTSLRRTATLPERKGAVQLIHSILLRRPFSIAANQRSAMLSQLIAELDMDKSLVREVDLGPFKHRIDEGLELRKMAFDAIAELLQAPRSFFTAETTESLRQLGKQICDALLQKDEDGEVLRSSRQQLVKFIRRFPQAMLEDPAVLKAVVEKQTVAITAQAKEGQDAERLAQGACAAICLVEVLAAWKPANADIAAVLKTARSSVHYARAKLEL